MGLSWDHSTGRKIVALFVALLLAFSLVGIIAAGSSGDVDTAAPMVEVADGETLVALGGSWSFMSYDPSDGFGGMSARGASWS